jgi:hypothetical protein
MSKTPYVVQLIFTCSYVVGRSSVRPVRLSLPVYVNEGMCVPLNKRLLGIWRGENLEKNSIFIFEKVKLKLISL